MTFAFPWLLLLLALPGALIAWEAARPGVRVRLPVDHALRRRRTWTTRFITGASMLPHALLALAIVLLAGPRRPGEPKAERSLTNIEICLDVSGSMTAPMPGGGARHDIAKRAIDEFTRVREGDAFGLTIFGSEVVRWTPLTKDLGAIRSATPFLNPETMPPHMGGTRIGNALRFAGRTLARQEQGDRLIILVSDGESSDLGNEASNAIAAELAAERIVVFTVHVGDGPAPPDLYAVVQPTGGAVFEAGDAAGLAAVFSHIDRMAPAREKPAAPAPVDWFAPFATAGLALLGLHSLALLGARWTPW